MFPCGRFLREHLEIWSDYLQYSFSKTLENYSRKNELFENILEEIVRAELSLACSSLLAALTCTNWAIHSNPIISMPFSVFIDKLPMEIVSASWDPACELGLFVVCFSIRTAVYRKPGCSYCSTEHRSQSQQLRSTVISRIGLIRTLTQSRWPTSFIDKLPAKDGPRINLFQLARAALSWNPAATHNPIHW